MGLFNKRASGQTYDGMEASGTNKGAVGGLIQCNETNNVLVWKYPYNNIKRGAIVKVHDNQRAYLYINGQCEEILETGRSVVVDSNNLPFLERIMNVATGGETSYTCEIWFANITCESQIDFGFNGKQAGVRKAVKNPLTGMPIWYSINGYGSYRVHLKDAKLFIDKLVGTEHAKDTADVGLFFDNQVKVQICSVLNEQLKTMSQDIEALPEVLQGGTEINEKFQAAVGKRLGEGYGLELTNFSVMFNCPEFDEMMEKSQAGANEALEKAQMGSFYHTERQYDILNTAAGNEGAGNIMGIGMGLGMGNQIGGMMGGMMGNVMNGGPAQQAGGPGVPPPIPGAAPVKPFYFYIANAQVGPVAPADISSYVASGQITPATYAWCEGMAAWTPAGQVPQLSHLFRGATPPPPPPPVM